MSREPSKTAYYYHTVSHSHCHRKMYSSSTKFMSGSNSYLAVPMVSKSHCQPPGLRTWLPKGSVLPDLGLLLVQKNFCHAKMHCFSSKPFRTCQQCLLPAAKGWSTTIWKFLCVSKMSHTKNEHTIKHCCQWSKNWSST